MNTSETKSKRNTPRYAAFVLLATLLTALTCSLPFIAGRIGGGDVSLTSLPNFGQPTDNLSSSFTPTGSIPTATPLGGSGSTALGDACLPGKWNMDQDSVVDYLSKTMQGNNYFEFLPQSASGRVQLQFVDGIIYVEVRDFRVDMQVNINVPTDAGDFSIVLNSTGIGNYASSQGFTLDITNITYETQGTMTTALGSIKIDSNDLGELAKDLKFVEKIPEVIEARNMNFTCQGDELAIQVNSYSWLLFYRALH